MKCMESVEKNDKQGYLLLDEAAVQSSENCRLRFCSGVKDPSNPVIRAIKPWEGNGPYTCTGRILWFPEEGVYRMPYSTYQSVPYAYGNGYAESRDGLNWERPALKGKKDDEFFLSFHPELGAHGYHRLPSFPFLSLYDPRPECLEEERFKGMRWSWEGNRISTSADGLTDIKTYIPDTAWMTTADNLFPLWDPKLQKFVCYYKLWRIWAEEKDDSPEGSHPITDICVSWRTRDLDDGWMELYGDWFVEFNPVGKARRVSKSYIVRGGNKEKGDGGGGQLEGAWYSKRVLCRAVSSDFIHWEEEEQILNVDEWDRTDSNIQYATIFRMGGYYLAILSMHDNRGHFDQQLAFSVDGICWKRPWRGNLICHGAPGSFDYGEVSPPTPPVITETQMLIYYGGIEKPHIDPSDRGQIGIGRVILRRDGFACWQAWDETATLQTVAFPVKRDGLYLNVDAEGGWITAALMDENGQIIQGYEHEKCKKIIEDSATYPDCFIPIEWEGKDTLPSGKVSVQLRFSNASVYSVLI